MYTFTGCSGFYYDEWEKRFYPENLSRKEWLPYYAQYFKTVEINNSFYNLPETEKLKKWHEQTPGNFRFSMKGSRYVTHMKKGVNNRDVRDGINKFYQAVKPLKGKLGCVLWQLPGNLHRDDEKLNEFCSLLSTDFDNVIEFRHSSWFTDAILQILEDQEVGYCMISAPDDLPELIQATTDTTYVRFHGKNEWYDYNYSDEEIVEWQKKLQDIRARRVYLYFNNDVKARAVNNAKSMKEVMEETQS